MFSNMFIYMGKRYRSIVIEVILITCLPIRLPLSMQIAVGFYSELYYFHCSIYNQHLIPLNQITFFFHIKLLNIDVRRCLGLFVGGVV